MKYLVFTTIGVCLLMGVFAQPCTNYNSGILAFEDYNNPGLTAFAGSEALPCMQLGQLTNVALPFKTYDSVVVYGVKKSVYKMKLEQVSNLPCGMCWTLSPGQNPYVAGEYSAILLHGTPTGSVGQYVVQVLLSFDTDNDGSMDVLNKPLADIAGAPLIVRLIGPEDVCVPVNVNAQGQVCQ
ncbi:MAG: hypothetical protein IPH78_09550 [Bacteroidetes bacterium]|jgi:hypothetical protein|nr:hypothetical protein [Bacteroidota bacterium]MBK8659348.1 hypothetical protein [Bacteroidota bacterium]